MTELNNQAPKPKGLAPPYDEWEIDNLPNRLTLLRMVLIPIISTCLVFNLKNINWFNSFKSELGWIAAISFGIAGLTDFFDGYIARKRGMVTVFGSFLDPVADKFLVVSSLILLQALDRIHVLIVIILVLREMYITSLRLLASERGLSVPVGVLGKWKTGFQLVAIPLLMIYEKPYGIPMPLIGTALLYLASFFSLYSALEYSLSLIKKIKVKRRENRKLNDPHQAGRKRG